MAETVSVDSVAQDQLRAFIERIERMEEEKQAIADDIKEIYAEAKGNGFDTKVLRLIVRIRKQDHAERMEQEALLDLYMAALGMQSAPRDEDDDGDAGDRATVTVRQNGVDTVIVGGPKGDSPAAQALMQRAVSTHEPVLPFDRGDA